MENTVTESYLAILLVNNAKAMGFTVTSLQSHDGSILIQRDNCGEKPQEWQFASVIEGHAFLEGVKVFQRKIR